MTGTVAGTRAEYDGIAYDAIGSSFGCDRDPSDLRRMADRFTDVGVGGNVAATWGSRGYRGMVRLSVPGAIVVGAAQRPLTWSPARAMPRSQGSATGPGLYRPSTAETNGGLGQAALKRRSRTLLVTTKMELNAMAAPAIRRFRSPRAARGIAATL